MNSLLKFRLLKRFKARTAFFKSESGTINIMAGLLIIPIIGIISIAVELGASHGTRVENQYAADIAALAAALDFSVASDATRAETVAIAALTAAGFDSGADILDLSIVPSPVNAANQAIQVEVSTTQQYVFAGLLGASTSSVIDAIATVEISGGEQNACLIALEDTNSVSVVGAGGSDLVTPGCGIAANGAVDVSGGTDFTLASISTAADLTIQGGSSVTTMPSANNILENAPPVTDPFFDFAPLQDNLGLVGAAANATTPPFPSNSLFDDFDVPSPFGGTTSFTFQGKTLTRGADLIWVAPPGVYYIDRYRATDFNERVRFTGTPTNPSTVWILEDINMGFGAELYFENTNVFSQGDYRHNGGGNPLDFGDGDITFTEIRITGTSQLVIGDGDLNITEDGLTVGGSSNVVIGNGEKTIDGDLAIGGQASLTFGSGDLHIRGDFDPSGSSTFVINTPSTGVSNVFINGDYVGGSSGQNTFTDTSFFVDGDVIFNSSLTVTAVNAQFFSNGIFDIAASNGSVFITPPFDGTTNIDQVLFATTSTQQSIISGGGNVTLGGVIHIPNGDFLLTGGGEINQNSECLLLVTQNFSLQGGSELNSQCDVFPPGFAGGPGTLALVQ